MNWHSPETNLLHKDAPLKSMLPCVSLHQKSFLLRKDQGLKTLMDFMDGIESRFFLFVFSSWIT